MKEINFVASACRYCRFYNSEGRRGGQCQMLDVPVEGSWKACTFASSPFETTLQKLEDIFHLETSIEQTSHQNTPVPTSSLEIKIEDNFQTTISHKSE